MAGYANRTVYLEWPDLTEEGSPTVHLIIKNPKIVPLDELQPADVGPDGGEAAARAATYRVIASLIKAGHVYDATSLDDDQPLLPLPMTPDSVARLPMEILKTVSDLVMEVLTPPN